MVLAEQRRARTDRLLEPARAMAERSTSTATISSTTSPASRTRARKEFFYFNDDGQLVAMRRGNWKVVFAEQRVPGTLRVWAEPFTPLRFPKIFHLRADPYERADITSNTYYDWLMSDGAAPMLGGPTLVGEFFKTFKEYPPSQRPASFSIDQMTEALQRSLEGPAK